VGSHCGDRRVGLMGHCLRLHRLHGLHGDVVATVVCNRCCNPGHGRRAAPGASRDGALYLRPSWAASSVGRAPPLHGGGRRRAAPQDARVGPTIGPAVCNPVCKPWGRDTGVSAEVDERRPL